MLDIFYNLRVTRIEIEVQHLVVDIYLRGVQAFPESRCIPVRQRFIIRGLSNSDSRFELIAKEVLQRRMRYRKISKVGPMRQCLQIVDKERPGF